MGKFKLSDSDNEKVKKAIQNAESKTSGEIVTAIINESSSYAFYELLVSLAFGFIYYLFSLMNYSNIVNLLKSKFWAYSEIYPTVFIGVSTIIVVGFFYLLCNINGVDRLIVPRKIIDKKVKRRAQLFFGESGLINTRDRTGVLIFISIREKRVELIADSGINALVLPDTWTSVLGDLIVNIKAKRIADGLVEAVGSCGRLLVEHFPIKSDDTNELSDDVRILED